MALASILFLLSSTPYKNCASPDHAHLSDLSISPDPPVHGENVNLKITMTRSRQLTRGRVSVCRGG